MSHFFESWCYNPKFPRSISLSILALFSLNSVQVHLLSHTFRRPKARHFVLKGFLPSFGQRSRKETCFSNHTFVLFAKRTDRRKVFLLDSGWRPELLDNAQYFHKVAIANEIKLSNGHTVKSAKANFSQYQKTRSNTSSKWRTFQSQWTTVILNFLLRVRRLGSNWTTKSKRTR